MKVKDLINYLSDLPQDMEVKLNTGDITIGGMTDEMQLDDMVVFEGLGEKYLLINPLSVDY